MLLDRAIAEDKEAVDLEDRATAEDKEMADFEDKEAVDPEDKEMADLEEQTAEEQDLLITTNPQTHMLSHRQAWGNTEESPAIHARTKDYVGRLIRL